MRKAHQRLYHLRHLNGFRLSLPNAEELQWHCWEHPDREHRCMAQEQHTAGTTRFWRGLYSQPDPQSDLHFPTSRTFTLDDAGPGPHRLVRILATPEMTSPLCWGRANNSWLKVSWEQLWKSFCPQAIQILNEDCCVGPTLYVLNSLLNPHGPWGTSPYWQSCKP